jgi:hypothetical protein
MSIPPGLSTRLFDPKLKVIPSTCACIPQIRATFLKQWIWEANSQADLEEKADQLLKLSSQGRRDIDKTLLFPCSWF